MALTKITKQDYADKGVIGLPDTPQLSTSEMQRRFDEIAIEVLVPKHNEMIDELEGVDGAKSIGTSDGSNVQTTLETLNRKIAASTGDLSKLIDDIADAKADISVLQTDDAKNQTDIATNKTDISALKTDNTQNKAKISSLESDVTVLNAQKHMHTNKPVLDALSKDSDGDLNFEGQKIKGGGGSSNAYGHIKVGSTTLNAVGDDTFELVAGSNVTMTTSGKQIIIGSSGGGGTSTGDMLKADFVLPGGTGQVLSAKEADHATNADNATNATNATNAVSATTAVSATSATKADQVGSALTSVLEKLGETTDGKLTFGGDEISVDIDNTTITENASGELQVADSLTSKLAKLDTDKSATEGQALAWNDTNKKYEPQTVKGGHDMYKELKDIPKDTEGFVDIPSTDEHVMSAHAVFEVANTKTYIIPILAEVTEQGGTGVGTWCDKEPNTWTNADMTDWIGNRADHPEDVEISALLKKLDADNIEVALMYDPSTNETVYNGGWQLDTTKGCMCIRFGNTITKNANIGIKLTVTTNAN